MPGKKVASNIMIRLFDAISRIPYRDIFGLGMMVIGVVAVWKPAGSILTAQSIFGIEPIGHGIWYVVSGWLLSKYGNRSAVLRFMLTLPLLFYIFITMIWIYHNWERANLIIPVQYIMLYAATLRLIVIREH